MAPIAKPKVVPDGFFSTQNGKKICCTFCTAVSPTGEQYSLEWPSLTTHLNSGKHKNAVRQSDSARARAAKIQQDQQNDLARRRDAQMQFAALQDVQIPEQPRLARVQTAAETELWEQLDMDLPGAGFELGVDKSTQQYNDLCNEMNSLWNAGIMAKDSGFALGEGNEAEEFLQADEDDEFLAEIMQNAGARQVLPLMWNGPVICLMQRSMIRKVAATSWTSSLRALTNRAPNGLHTHQRW